VATDMGRGRSKAKQTKVARDLKYSAEEIDIESLTKELHRDAQIDNNQQPKIAHSESHD
jgi:hypothetical protein